MYVAMVRVQVKPEYCERFEAMLIARSAMMSSVKGLIDFRILRPKSPETPYVNYSLWDSEADMVAFNKSEASHAAHAEMGDLRDAFVAPPQREAFDVMDY